MSKIIFGGIYTANQKLRIYFPNYYNHLNDQRQNYWFPIRVTKDDVDGIYMLDTYQFDMPYKCQQNYDEMIKYLKSLGEPKDHTWVKNKAYDYYYSAVIKLNNTNIEAFDLVANLEEYEIVNYDESRYYDSKDVIHDVMFWNYHRSGRGVIIKKKDAKLCYDLKIDNLYCDVISSIKKPYIGSYEFQKLLECEKEAVQKGATYDKNKILYIIKMEEYIKKADENFVEYSIKIKKELGVDEW